MEKVERINYKNARQKALDFEIDTLQSFFALSTHAHMTQHYRVNFWVIIYIIEGEGSHIVDFETYTYKAGDIILVHKNQVQCFKVKSNVNGYIIHINEPFLFQQEGLYVNPILSFFESTYKSPILSIDTSIDTTNRFIIDLIYNEYLKQKEHIYEKLIHSLLISFIYAINQETMHLNNQEDSKTFRVYNDFKRLVEEHYASIRTVSEYAVMMNLSKKVINSATQCIVGLTAKQFIIERVLLEIKRYLSLNQLLTYEIADILNFDSPANMTKFFKRYEGISPKEYKSKTIHL